MKFLIAFLCFVLGALFFVPCADTLYEYYSSAYWDASQATITSSYYEEYQCKDLCGKNQCKGEIKTVACYRPKISYEYLAGSHGIYKGSSISLRFDETDHVSEKNEASTLVDRFPVGDKFPIKYKIYGNKIKSYLIRDANLIGSFLGMLLSIIFISISVGFLVAGYRKVKTNHS